MTEREKLILYLQNLAKAKSKVATLDVTFLLEILNALPKEQPKPTSIRLDNVDIEVDGGKFSEGE